MGNGRINGERSRGETLPFTSVVRSAPESILLLALFILAAIAAQRAGALPGGGIRVPGGAATALFCACLYGSLGYACIRVSLREGSARKILRMLGICLVLAVISAYGLMRVLSPATWDKFFYFRFFAFPALAGLWCAALLPGEARELLRAAGTSPAGETLRPLAALLAAAAILVTGSDLALQFGDVSIPGIEESVIQKNAWAAGIAILFAFYALAFAVTRRVGTALLLVTPFFVALGLSTIAKLRYMHSPVVPLDLLSIREFLPFFRPFFGDGVLAASVCGLVAWIVSLLALQRTVPRRVPLACRLSIGGLSLSALAAVPLLICFFPSLELDRRIGSPTAWNTNQQESVRTSGFLLSFLSEIPASFVTAPSGYSRDTVAAALRRYPGYAAPPAGRGHERRVNLIVYMVESLMDPDDLGWRYSSDPIPNLRALGRTGSAGTCVVPGEHSGSSDSEFEALTGMTMSFLPERSLAYRQFVREPLPSLPADLKRLGYRTFAVQADPKGFYNRVQAYGQLGFDDVFWLNEAPDAERAVNRFWPSDNAIVDAVIRASRQNKPFFAFAFPSSTHSPYNNGLYGNSGLNVLDPLPGSVSAEVKEYINLLGEADRAIGRLVGHFRGRPDP
ncbi:MAG: LTA synthase family protein, partial [Deltaproteobacteria bacterium]|nr:LTA synthase family protein [Deltaproteobacteria bacterium]